jgi:hypothetical protein
VQILLIYLLKQICNVESNFMRIQIGKNLIFIYIDNNVFGAFFAVQARAHKLGVMLSQRGWCCVDFIRLPCEAKGYEHLIQTCAQLIHKGVIPGGRAEIQQGVTMASQI